MSTRFLSRLPLLILLGVCCSDAMGQAQATQAPVALSKEEAEKLLVKAPEAPYPAIGDTMRLRGVVMVAITVSKAGDVVSARVTGGHPLLQGAALKAAKKYKYKPHTVDGKPVPFTTSVPIAFPKEVLTRDLLAEIQREEELAREYFQIKPNCRNLNAADNWKQNEEACRNLVRIADQLPATRALEKMGAYEQLGWVLAQQRRFPEAIESFKLAFIPVKSVLDEDDVELAYLHTRMAITYHGQGDLEQARASYRQAEKIYQNAYKDMSKGEQSDDFSERLKKSYAQQLRKTLELHLKAAEKSGATAEVEEIKSLMKIYQ